MSRIRVPWQGHQCKCCPGWDHYQYRIPTHARGECIRSRPIGVTSCSGPASNPCWKTHRDRLLQAEQRDQWWHSEGCCIKWCESNENLSLQKKLLFPSLPSASALGEHATLIDGPGAGIHIDNERPMGQLRKHSGCIGVGRQMLDSLDTRNERLRGKA